MTKNVKIAAIVSAAALLAVGASMTSFAAGWTEENGTWVYYDRDGDQVTEDWEKSGDNWYYLNDEGEMATDVIVEDDNNYYYVDANGAMVTNNWVEITNEDAGDDENQPDTWWYYFGSNGKAYKKSDNTTHVALKTINGKKYSFDDEGHMLFGWVDYDDGEMKNDDDAAWQTCEYYFGEASDGAMTVGWREIAITDDDAEDQQPGDSFWDEDQVRWFWFKSSGKKQTSSDGKTINGKKYAFDEYGRMIADWYTADASANTASQGSATYSNTFMYFSTPEDGARYTKGWFKVVPGYYLHESKYEDGSEYWYYADGSGNIYSNVIKTINGKKYAFDNYGRMINGLVFLEMEPTASGYSTSAIVQKFADDGTDPYDTEDNFDDFVSKFATEINDSQYACYYFGGSDDGSMKTNTQTVDIDGDSFKFYFRKSGSKKGQGYVGEDSHKLYLAGKLVKASKDDKCKIYEIVNDSKVIEWSTEDFLASSHVTAKTVKDDTTTYTIDKPANFVLVNTSGVEVKSGSKKDGDDYQIHTDNYKIDKITIKE